MSGILKSFLGWMRCNSARLYLFALLLFAAYVIAVVYFFFGVGVSVVCLLNVVTSFWQTVTIGIVSTVVVLFVVVCGEVI